MAVGPSGAVNAASNHPPELADREALLIGPVLPEGLAEFACHQCLVNGPVPI